MTQTTERELHEARTVYDRAGVAFEQAGIADAKSWTVYDRSGPSTRAYDEAWDAYLAAGAVYLRLKTAYVTRLVTEERT